MDKKDPYDRDDLRAILLLAADRWWNILPFESQQYWGGSPEEAVDGLLAAYDRGER